MAYDNKGLLLNASNSISASDYFGSNYKYVSNNSSKTSDFTSYLDKAQASTDSKSNETVAVSKNTTEENVQENPISEKDMSENLSSEDLPKEATTETSQNNAVEENLDTKGNNEDTDKIEAGNNEDTDKVKAGKNDVSTTEISKYMSMSGSLEALLNISQQVKVISTNATNKNTFEVVATKGGAKEKINSAMEKTMVNNSKVSLSNSKAVVKENLATEKQAVPNPINIAGKISQQADSKGVTTSINGLLAGKDSKIESDMLNMLSGNTIQRRVVDGQTNLKEDAQTGIQLKVDKQSAQLVDKVNPKEVNDQKQESGAKNLSTMLEGAEIKIETKEQPTSQNQQFDQRGNSRGEQQGRFVDNAQQPQAQNVALNAESTAKGFSLKNTVDIPQQASAENNDASLMAGLNVQQTTTSDVIDTQQTVVNTPQQQYTDYDVPQQIVDQVKLIKAAENTEMVIKLNPEHLGELSLKVSVNGNGGVTASFHSDSSVVRGILETSMLQLKNELNEQGIKVDKIEISASLQDGQLPQDSGQGFYQPQGQQGTATRGDLRNYENRGISEDDLVINPLNGEMVNNSVEQIRDSKGNVLADGVDYRV